ncbi:MAG: hypothetical protein WC840_06700 [Candidatus Peribacteraceae bacterium]
MLPKNKQRFSGLFTVTLILLAAGLWSGFFVPMALAQAGGAGTAVRGSLSDDLVQWMSKLAAINTFMHILLLIILDFLGYFLRADFFTNPKMMEALNNIWVLSRDIMNIIFALMLIGVAFYTIITGNSKYIKEKITQFVIAVILVNFSWFFPRVIIDVANILTGTVYAVPQMLPNFTCQRIQGNPPMAGPCKVIINKMIFGSEAEQAEWKLDVTKGNCSMVPDEDCPCTVGIGCYRLEEYEAAKNKMEAAHAMINGLAVSFANITQLPKIPAGTLPSGPITSVQAATTTFQILMNVMFAFIMQLAIVLPLLGMAVGFLIRILVIWLTTAFMPFSFLGYVITGKLGTNVFGFEVDIWQEFINAAFLPAVVGIPIVIGFILLSTSASIPAPQGGTDLTIPILSGVATWWQMIWMIAAVMIMWKGSFAALSKSKLVGGITDKIKGFGEWVGKGAMQIPLITPLPMAGGMTAGQALRRAGAELGAFGDVGWGRASNRDEAVRRRMGGNMAEADALANTLHGDAMKTRNIIDAMDNLKTIPIGDISRRKTQFEKIHMQLGWAAGAKSGADTLDMVREIAYNNRAPAALRDMQIRSRIEEELRKEHGTAPAAPKPK